MERRDYIETQKKFECNNCSAINCINKNKNQKCKGYCTGDYWGKKTDPFLFDGITIQEGIFCKELLEEKQMVKKEKCTSEEWDHCRVEKMGCAGCYYDNTLEEAKNNLTKLVELRKNKCGEIKFDTCICGTKDLEIVLNALEDKYKNNIIKENKK